MELTELFSGSRNRKRKRTAQLKEISGFPLLNTLVTGATTARKALESSTTKMATNTKECGPLINATVKELTGEMKKRNLDVNTQATGSKIKSMVEEHFSTRTETVTTGTGSTACHKGRAA